LRPINQVQPRSPSLVQLLLPAAMVTETDSHRSRPSTSTTWGNIRLVMSHPLFLRPSFLREYDDIPCNSWGIIRKLNFGTRKRSLLQGACKRVLVMTSWSTRGECRWPRADAAAHLYNRACAAVIRLHAPRVSLLLLLSCSFPDMRPYNKFLSLVQKFDWFPRIIGNIIGFPAKRLGFANIIYYQWRMVRSNCVPVLEPGAHQWPCSCRL